MPGVTPEMLGLRITSTSTRGAADHVYIEYADEMQGSCPPAEQSAPERWGTDAEVPVLNPVAATGSEALAPAGSSGGRGFDWDKDHFTSGVA